MQMGRLEFTTPRAAWGGEATTFTPLLAEVEMLDYLGAATGLGHLTLIETEHATAGGRSLDILAEAGDGRRVAIENQYNTADHDHLTRGLAYAVATDSRALIVIAEGHRDEFVSVAEYLNDVASARPDGGISVWLIQVRAVRRVGDSIWSPEFVVIARPNEWEAEVRADTPARLQSVDDFYSRCASGEFAEFARTIVEDWAARPGARADHNTKRVVGLFHPSPRYPTKGSNVVQLDTGGGVYVCRGYIRDASGVFDPLTETEDLDRKIRELFPDARWTEKGGYIDIGHCSQNLPPFLTWLADRYNEALSAGEVL